MLVGVLSLQGDFGSHEQALREIGIDTVQVRRPEDAGFANPGKPLKEAMPEAMKRDATSRPIPEGLILPGGESSTIDLLGRRYGLDRLLAAYAATGRTLFGTCAGAIWLGKGNPHKVTPLELIDVDLERNAYGRQIDSFIAEIDIDGLDSPFEAVWIRAPKITRVGPGIRVLASFEGDPVLVRKDNIWLATFHPERSADRRLHHLIFQQ